MKGLNRLWLRTAKKISRAQQSQQKKLVKSLLPKPVAKKTAKVAAIRPGRTAASVVYGNPARAADAAARPLSGKWLSAFYSSGIDVIPARRLQYWLYLPSTMTDAPIPLVVMLHGCAQTATQFAQGTGMNRLAEEKGFAVLYPQQSVSVHPNRCWTWYDKATQEGGGDARLIAGVIDSVAQHHAIDRSRIYIAGMSAGASMANIVALNNPHLIAAVGLHSGAVFGGGHSKMGALGVMQRGETKPVAIAIEKVVERFGTFPPMPAILIHGQADNVVRSVNLNQLTQQFCRLNRLPPDSRMPPVVKPAGKARRNPAHAFITVDYMRGRKPIVRACDILQLEHAWCGGDGTLRFNSGAGPNAAKMMWSFFAQHRRAATGHTEAHHDY
jgi:poly(hydroxyalkanoate) depolymerase family esterase